MSIRHIDVTCPGFAVSRVMKTHLVTTENICMLHHQSHAFMSMSLKGTFGKFIDKNGPKCICDYIKHVIDFFFPLNPGLQIYAII